VRQVTSLRKVGACLTLIAVSSLAACAPAITKRYRTVAGTLGPAVVTVSGSTFAIDPAGPKTIFDLGAEGQAALVEAVAAKVEDPASLTGTIAAPIARPPSSGIHDLTTLSRRVVLSINAKHDGLADRLDYCAVTLRMAAGGAARFKTWNQLTTRFESIDLGKMNFTQKGTLSAGLEGTAPGSTEISKATLGATAERSLAEEVILRQRYVASSGVLTDTEAKVIQQGAVGLDLVGNIVVDLTVTARASRLERLYRVENLFAKNGTPNEPGVVRLVRRIIRVPEQITGGWTAQLDAEFRRRIVAFGADTISEADDDVTYQSGIQAGDPVTLATEDELRVSRWLLMTSRDEVLHVQEPDGPMVLQFDSFDGARDFLVWLIASNASQVGGRPLGFAGVSGKPELVTPTAEGRWKALHVEIQGVNWSVGPPPKKD
jgi:hypothetical protein